MQLNKIIVHEIIKEVNNDGANCEYSRLQLPIDNKSENLINKLDEKYISASVTNGIFSNIPKEFFPNNFQNLMKNYNEKNFIDFTINAVNALRDQIKNIKPAKGGYFVFADYEKNGVDLFGIFLIRNTNGMLFHKDSDLNSFVINITTHIDLEKLAMACRINLTRYNNNDGKYLSFMKHKIPDISDYFINWIAAIQMESSALYTDELYKISARLPRPKDENGNEISLDEFRKNIYDYMSTRPEGYININDMSRHFYDDDQIIIDFIEENNITIDSEFKFDSRKAKKFIRIDVNADGIHLRFSRGEYNSIVRIDENNPNIIIIESEKFANRLRDEINTDE